MYNIKNIFSHARAYFLGVLLLTPFFLYADVKDDDIRAFNPNIQREVLIIDSVHGYDLNPHTANYSSEAQILNGLYEGLFSYDPMTAEALPAAVKSFRVSRDRKTWTFVLKNDLKFSNGDAVEAKDVVRSWLTLLNPETKAPFASLLDCVKGAADYREGKAAAEAVDIRVKNSHTLAVRLNAPAEHLPKILCHHAFAITHVDKNVYSGPFVLAGQKSKELLLKKNTYYYDADKVALPAIRIINSEDLKENTFAFNTGKAQWVTGGIEPEKIYKRADIIVYPQFSTEFFFFKAHKEPWKNALMRQAALALFPREELRQNAAVPAKTFILPLSDYPKIYGEEIYETDEAEALLGEALDELSKTLRKGKPLLRLAIPDFDYMKQKAALIADALQKSGIDVFIETSPGHRYLQSLRENESDMFTYTWIGDFADPLAFLELFRSSSSLRETEWTSKVFDTLLDEAALITDSVERYKKLAEAEQLLLDEAVIFPVSHPVSLNAVDTEVLGGWFTNPQDIHPFKYLFFKDTSKQREGFI
ncbi:peptide ABC transporter substrate-binding protein [Treponema sp. HNW]|uniref:peptide ABC transporter substrate-binding protein n=1 Tax=Treponema sp. HNW TaxID=3116654 RepID=UPI003D147A27